MSSRRFEEVHKHKDLHELHEPAAGQGFPGAWRWRQRCPIGGPRRLCGDVRGGHRTRRAGASGAAHATRRSKGRGTRDAKEQAARPVKARRAKGAGGEVQATEEGVPSARRRRGRKEKMRAQERFFERGVRPRVYKCPGHGRIDPEINSSIVRSIVSFSMASFQALASRLSPAVALMLLAESIVIIMHGRHRRRY
jgi:hypothetical protein